MPEDEFAEDLAITEAIRSHVGKHSRISLVSSSDWTYKTLLSEIERHLAQHFTVYLIENTPPEIFSLAGFVKTPIVVSRSYFSAAKQIAQILLDDNLVELRTDLLRRSMLKLSAEFALSSNKSDFAVLAFLESMIGKSVWISDDAQVGEFVNLSMEESELVLMLYGLAHEAGHIHHSAPKAESVDFAPDDWVLDAIHRLLDFRPPHGKLGPLPEDLKVDAARRAMAERDSFVLGIDRIREEGTADIFAAVCLLNLSTVLAPFDPSQQLNRFFRIVVEVLAFFHVYEVIDSCSRLAGVARFGVEFDRLSIGECFLHPVATGVRHLMVRTKIDDVLATMLAKGDTPTEEHRRSAREAIDEVERLLVPKLESVDEAVAALQRFSLSPEDRPDDWILLERFRCWLPSSTLLAHEAKIFVDRARATGKSGALLEMLSEVLANPQTPVVANCEGDSRYLLWLQRKDGLRGMPVVLPTILGNLVLAFLPASERIRQCGEFVENILPQNSQYHTATCVVRASREAGIATVLRPHLPSADCALAVEGVVEDFDEILDDLLGNRLWSNKLSNGLPAIFLPEPHSDMTNTEEGSQH